MAVDSNQLILAGTGITITIGGADVGYTTGGLRMRVEQDHYDFKADQAMGTIKKSLIERRVYLTTTIQEGTLGNLRAAMNLNATALVSSSLTIDNSEAGNVTVVFVGTNAAPNAATRTITAAQAVAVSTGEQVYSKDTGLMVEVEFECLFDSDGDAVTIVDTADA